MNNILAFFQRLFSPVGESNVKQAWLELSLIVGAVTGLISSFKLKDWGSILQQADAFWGALGLLIVAVRAILSSNEKGILNPTLPKVTGVVNAN